MQRPAERATEDRVCRQRGARNQERCQDGSGHDRDRPRPHAGGTTHAFSNLSFVHVILKGTHGLVASTLPVPSTAVTWIAKLPAAGGLLHVSDHPVAVVPGALSVASKFTIAACHVEPFHHCIVVTLRIATRTFVTETSSVALPVNVRGPSGNDWFGVGDVTVALGAAWSGLGGV